MQHDTHSVLLTGGTGNLGSRLIPLLQQKGFRVLVLSEKPPRDPIPSVTYIQADIVSKDSLEQTLARYSFDSVIHAAAVTHSHTQSLYFSVNVTGTQHILDIAETRKVTRFVYMSTRAAGREGGAYSASKALAEDIVMKSNLNWVILKPAEVYGGNSADALSTLCSFIAQGIAPVIGDGTYALTPVHADDVLNATVRALLSPSLTHRTYVLAGPDTYTYNELVRILASKLHRKPLVMHIPFSIASLLAKIAKIFRSTTIVEDQLPRLRMQKPTDITAARQDLGFNPAHISEAL